MRSADEWPQFALDKLTRSPPASKAFDKKHVRGPDTRRHYYAFWSKPTYTKSHTDGNCPPERLYG